MRQRLSEITGLSSEDTSPAIRNSTTSPANVAPEHADFGSGNSNSYDGPPNYDDIADYAHYIEPSNQDFEPQKELAR